MSHDHSIVVPAPGPGFLPHTVAHHFDTATQEFQSAKLGFWLFLATEILLFGGLFAGYFYYHGLYPETFHHGSHELSWKLGALNTSVLLISSWTMAMGVRSAQTSQKQKLLLYCGLTVLGAAIFMTVKYFEYRTKWEHGFLPLLSFAGPKPFTASGKAWWLGVFAVIAALSVWYRQRSGRWRAAKPLLVVAVIGLAWPFLIEAGLLGWLPTFADNHYDEATGQLAWFTDVHNTMVVDDHGQPLANPSMFFAFYLTMTGLHGLHVLVGAGLIIWVMFGAAKGRFHAHYFLPVDLVGLYWHLVDLIWIFLFPLLYLVS
jgi:cytochrome c oxidase subunit 3